MSFAPWHPVDQVCRGLVSIKFFPTARFDTTPLQLTTGTPLFSQKAMGHVFTETGSVLGLAVSVLPLRFYKEQV